jgi:hypothetical protein
MGYRESSPPSELRSAERFYSSSTAQCESRSGPSNSSVPNSDDQSNSFFDMAQQWALENLPKPSDVSDKRSAMPNATTESDSTNNVKEANIFDGPEQFLKGIGLLGSVDNAFEDRKVDPTLPPDNSKEASPFNVKDTLQKYIHKFQAPVFNNKGSEENTPQEATKDSDDSIISDFVSFFFSPTELLG